MDKNQITGLLLMALLLIGYYQFFAPEPVPVEEKTKKETVVNNKDTTQTVAQPKEIAQEQDSGYISQKFGDFATVAQGTEREIVVESENLQVTFSTKGGGIKKVVLAEYLTQDKKPLVLIDENSSKLNYILPLANGDVNIGDLYFNTDQKSISVSAEDTVSITFSVNLPSGKSITQTYKIGGTGYQVGYNMQLLGFEAISEKNLTLHWINHMKNTEKHVAESRKKSTINYYLASEEFDNLDETSEEKEEKNLSEPIKWVSMKQNFFTSAVISNKPFNQAYLRTEVNPEDDRIIKETEVRLGLSIKDIEGGGTDLTYFFGPNKYQVLKKVSDGFSKNVYLGWAMFAWVNKFLIIPIFNFLERFIGSYGIIIIILVLIIKLLLFPLSYKSYLSMAKTKVLKPELDEIKEKHGSDMQKVQTEQMQLYQKVGVNPLSGCIPVLLQMPILFAMFYFFPNSIELRQEAFLWADDLSTYDSVLSLPFSIPAYGAHVSLFALLMTLSTILYTWSNNQMTNVQGPMKSMGYIMPVVFLFILNSLPAGLSFYYFVSNVITFGQQAVIRKFVDEGKIRAILDENKKRNQNKKKSKFQTRLEEAMKLKEEDKKSGKK